MKKIVSLICVLVLLLSVSGCKKALENTEPNGEIVSNGGIVMKQGNWIYYINGSMPPTVNDALANTPRARIYRMRPDGSEKQAITDKKAYGMYVYGETLFYTSPTKDSVIVYTINIDGTKNKKLIEVNDSDFISFGEKGIACEKENQIHYFDYATLEEKVFDTGVIDDIRISDNYIYYCADSVMGIKRIEIQTGLQETLTERVGLMLYATDEVLYFVSTRIPFKVNTNTLELTQISESLYRKLYFDLEKRYMVTVLSDTADKGLFLQPIDNVAGEAVEEGKNKLRLQVHTKSASAITTTSDYIFFVEEETNDVYRMTFEGTEKTVLGNVPSVLNTYAMEVIDDTLYIMDGQESGNIYSVKIDGTSVLSAILE